MKKVALITLTALLAFVLCACGNSGSSSSSSSSSTSSNGTAAKASFTPQTHRIATGSTSCAAILDDKTVACSLDTSGDQHISVNGEWKQWTDVVDISMQEELLAAVKADGTVVWCGGRVKEYDCLNDPEIMGDIDKWKDVVQVSAGFSDIAVLTKDGNIEVTGSLWTGNLAETTGFTQVSVYNGLFALRKDGTVYCYAPRTFEGQTWSYDTSSWKDITQVDAGWDHAVALKKDGTVVATGNNDCGQCEVNGWTDIVQVCACRQYTVGLKKDGTVVSCGTPLSTPTLDLSGWTDIQEISCSFNSAMGLKADGTIVYAATSSDFNNPTVSSTKVS